MNSENTPFMPMSRRTLIELSSVSIILLFLFLSTLKFLLLDDSSFPLPAVFFIFIATANIIFLRRGGSTDIGAYLLISLLLLGLISGGMNNYAFSGPVVALASLIPIFSMLLVSTHAALITLSAVIFILSGLLYYQLTGAIPENTNPPELVIFGRFITVLALSILSTWITWSFARMSRLQLMKVERKSNTDHLTGILNRRGIQSALLNELARAKRTGRWISFILADVDHFKLYNDTNGHQAGDQCLVRIAKVLSTCRRRLTDIVGRFGGEEFIIILPDTANKGACKVAERIRNDILDEKISYGPGRSDFVSITLGLVSARGSRLDNIDELIREADEALYRGKEQGRNCVVSVVLDDTPSDLNEQ